MCGRWAGGARSPCCRWSPAPARPGQTTRCACPWWVHTATWGEQTAKQNGTGFGQACAQDAGDARRRVDGRRGVRAPLDKGGPRAMDVWGR